MTGRGGEDLVPARPCDTGRRAASISAAPTTGRRRSLSRRSFVAGLLAATACRGRTAAGFEPSDKAASPTGKAGPSPAYVDIHVHLTQAWYGQERGPLTARRLLTWMDAHGIAQAAVLPLVSPEAFWYPVTTEFVLRETAPHRDRLIPFCAIDPRALETHLTRTADVVDMLRRYMDAGARGFGEHKANLPIDHPLNLRLYEACAGAGLPVLFHLDNQANHDAPGLPGLGRVLERFSDLPLIGHGKGWWASISGGLVQSDLHVGYPKGPVAAGGAIDRLMDRHANLYGDLSSSGAWALLRDPEFGQAFLLRRADRLLFGTDYYDLGQQSFPQFELFERLKPPPDVIKKVAAFNAEKLLSARG